MIYLLLPLLAAIAFALGSMVYKRAFAEGANVSHALVVNNVFIGVVFLPLFALEPRPIAWEFWYRPVLTAAFFALGHLMNVVSLRAGDVSVATPILGVKVILVGIVGSALFGVHLPPGQWIAAALATAGVVAMGFTDLRHGNRIGTTTQLSLGCASAFAVTDLMIQVWGMSLGVFNFLPLQFIALSLISIALLPLLGGMKSLRAPAKAWPWILIACALSALQAILITGAIAAWGDAASVNVVYATRGLWSVALVWFIGHWIKNTERQTVGARSMTLRAAGATLILAAVGVIVWFTPRTG